jgi:hypothetical protein
MPFKSCAQQRAMFVHSPKVAREWVHKYGDVCKGQPTRPKSDEQLKAQNDHLRKKS